MYTNDNEHAKGNLFGFLFATKVALPIALQNERFSKKWPVKNKVVFYPSVKEAVYLSQQPELLSLNEHVVKKIYFRPEPWSAQYYKGPLNFFDDTLLLLSHKYSVVVLPRDHNQFAHYRQDKFGSLEVVEKPIRLSQIISDCLIFIGAGGSMTREIAVMGIPVISIYQDKLLQVDLYLVDHKLMKVSPNLTCEEIEDTIAIGKSNGKNLTVLEEGQKSFALFKELFNNLIQK